VSAWSAVVALALAFVALAAVRLWFVNEAQTTLVEYELRFPRQSAAEAVQRFLAGWSGSLPPVWKRWAIGVPPLIIETRAKANAIQHYLLVPKRWAPLVESLLGAHLPNVRYAKRGASPLRLNSAAEYRSNTSQRALAVDAAAISVGLLSSLQPLVHGEGVLVQYVLAPHAPVQPPRTQGGNGKAWWVSDPTYVDSSEAATALRKKQSAPLLLGVGRIGVRTATPERAQGLLRRVEAAWHGTRAPGVHLQRRWITKRAAAARLNRRVIPAFAWPGGAINVEEAAGLIGWPIDIEQLPGLTLGGCRLLPVPAAVARDGAILGVGTFPSTQRPVALDIDARQHHVLITGPTGSGKTVCLSRLALADLPRPGQALVVFDPKDGGLVDRIAAAMPESRLADTIIFDPTDARPVGFNPLACTPDTRELVVDQVDSIMAAVWKSNWGPRSSDLNRHALLTLTLVPGMTLVEAPRLLTDSAFRRSVLARVSDPEVLGFWHWFDNLSSAEQAAMTAAPTNKLRSLTGRAAIRHEIGHPKPAIDFDRIINEGGVLLVRLSAGLLGDSTASLLSALIATQLWQAIAARAALPTSQRRPAMVIIDEVQSVLRLPVNTIENMLTQARGYGVGVTLAHQHLQQLSTDVREAAMANTRSKVVFACSQRDATTFAREFGSSLTADDLRDIEAYEAVTTVFAKGRTQPPTTIAMLPPAEPLRDPEVVRAASRHRFGTNRDEVEAAIRERQNIATSTGSVGRKPRGSA
jgi:hypothetical protein